MAKLKALGIMGGTFDPPHYGHLLAAEWARFKYGLDKVIFVPAGIPPHKDPGQILEARHRFKMVELAIHSNPAFEISALEIERKGCSYTIDTIRYFHSRYPQAGIFFIMGADSLLIMDTWKNVPGLTQLCKFIVVTRPGYSINRDAPVFADLPVSLWDNLEQIEIPALDISSSDIRRRVGLGQPIKYLLPPELEDYIAQNNLYREE